MTEIDDSTRGFSSIIIILASWEAPAPRFGTRKSGSGGVVRRWSLLYVSCVVRATKKYRGKTGPVFGARRYAQMTAQMVRAVMENCGLYNGCNTNRNTQTDARIAQTAMSNGASTMATTPTVVINSEPARSPKTAFTGRHTGRIRNNNGPTFRCPQK